MVMPEILSSFEDKCPKLRYQFLDFNAIILGITKLWYHEWNASSIRHSKVQYEEHQYKHSHDSEIPEGPYSLQNNPTSIMYLYQYNAQNMSITNKMQTLFGLLAHNLVFKLA